MSDMEHGLSLYCAAESAGTPDLTPEPSASDSVPYVPTEADAYAVAAAAVAIAKESGGVSKIDLSECETGDSIPPLPSQDSDDGLPPLPSLPSESKQPLDPWDLAYLYRSDPDLIAATDAEAELQKLNRDIQEHSACDEYYKAKLLTIQSRLECAVGLTITTDDIDDKGKRLELSNAYASCADALQKLHVVMDGVAAGNIDHARAAASAAAATTSS